MWSTRLYFVSSKIKQTFVTSKSGQEEVELYILPRTLMNCHKTMKNIDIKLVPYSVLMKLGPQENIASEWPKIRVYRLKICFFDISAICNWIIGTVLNYTAVLTKYFLISSYDEECCYQTHIQFCEHYNASIATEILKKNEYRYQCISINRY